MSDQVRLSLQDLAHYRNQGHGIRSGKYLRFYCPIHGGDHQRSLCLDPVTGRFFCYSCRAWGYLEEKRQEWLEKRRQKWLERSRSNIAWKPSEVKKVSDPPTYEETNEPKARPELLSLLITLQENLPNSPGEEYLNTRGISLNLAQSFGIGYAPYGKWPHMKDGNPVRQWKKGRLVFPHTNPAGEIVNLYGRAVGKNEEVSKEERHDHLPYPKGVFNARALLAVTVFICEGVFNALSLMQAGYKDACAIFGVYGLRWDWVKAKRIVFCLDQDQAGQTGWRELAVEGVMRGLEVYWLPNEVYGKYKDLNEVWAATEKLNIGDWE